MQALLETTASNAFFVVILAALVAIVCRRVRNPHVVYWLWALVLIKLVTPPIVPIRVPALTGILPVVSKSAAEAEPSDVGVLAAAADTNGFHATSESGQKAVVKGADWSRPAFAWTWHQRLVALWAIGSSFLLGLVGWRTLRFGRLVQQAEPATDWLRAEAREAAARVGVVHCPDIRLVEGTFPPLLWPARRGPTIVLPADLFCSMNEQDRATLLAHELAHVRRRDHWVRWIEMLILAICWWHPIAWLASRRLREAEEQCCDAWVLWAYPSESKRYAQALLQTVEFLSRDRRTIPALASGFGYTNVLKKRFDMILQRRPERRLSWRGRLFVLILGLAVLPLSADLANDANADRPDVRKRAVRARVATRQKSRIEARLDSLEAAVKELTNAVDSQHKHLKHFHVIQLKRLDVQLTVAVLEKMLAGQPVTFAADKEHNRLLLHASEEDTANILTLIEKLDGARPPAQQRPSSAYALESRLQALADKVNDLAAALSKKDDNKLHKDQRRVTIVFRLKFLKAADASYIIKALYRDLNLHVGADELSNSLVVSAPSRILEPVKEMLLKLDEAAKGRKLNLAPETNKGRTIKDREATINDAGSTTRPAER